MRVAWLEPPSLNVQGDQVYRTVQPCRSLAQAGGFEVVAGHWLQPVMHEAAEAADVLVLCQAVDIDFLPLMARRKRAGRATLVELNDNFLEPRAFGDVGGFYHQSSQASLTMQLAACADGLMVSTPYLAQLFGFLNEAQLVLPNSIDCPPPAGKQALSPYTKSGNLRLGWAGSAGHAQDVAALVPALRTLLSRHPKITLCIMAPEALHRLFDWVPKARLDVRAAASLQDYLRFVATWDVGLAPLLDTPFNRGRSDIKFLEYTAGGVATVASRGPAYHTVVQGETGLLVDDFGAFVDATTSLIESRHKRQALVAQARRYAAQHRSHRHVHEALRRFIEAHGRRTHTTGSQGSWLRQLTATRPGHHGRSGETFSYLTSTPAEAQLFAALHTQQRTGDGAAMLQAQQSMPGCYLPHLYAGAGCAEPTRALEHFHQAELLAPHSLAVGHHLTRTYLAAGDTAQASRVAQAHLHRLPRPLSYAPLWELLALAHSTAGNLLPQAQALTAALEANTAYGPPARALAALVVEGGPWPEDGASKVASFAAVAATALHRSLTGFHPDYADAFYLGRLAAHAGAWADALQHFTQALELAQAQRREDAPRLCLAWLAKAALASGDVASARRYLVRSGRKPGPAVGAAAPMTQ